MALEKHGREGIASAATLTIGEKSAPGAQLELPIPPGGKALGRYVVLEQIGAGGMGRVFRAYDPTLQREVAIKILRLDKGGSSGGGDRLLREAQAMAQLSHPNVVPIYDVETEVGTLFIAMEYVAGQTLRSWLKTRPAWPRIIDAFLSAGRGLDAAHTRGLVHRDFKLNNIMVGDDGRVRVMDFGLARAEGGSGTSSAHPASVHSEDLSADLTEQGVVLGTPVYMAPEQHRGQPADARSDQYSFCVALFEGLYGERPFSATQFGELELLKRRGPPARPDDAKTPIWAHRVLARGLEPDPAKRWPTMHDLLRALAHDPIARRRRWLAAGALGVALGGGAAGVAYAQVERGQMCQGGPERLGDAWDATRRAEVEAALSGIDSALAGEALERARTTIDAYQDDWLAQYQRACEATNVRAEQSDRVMDLRMACLDRARNELATTTEALARRVDEANLEQVVGTVRALPRLERCADVDILENTPVEPEAPTEQEAADRLRTKLGQVRVLTSLGRPAAALALALEADSEARALAFLPLEAEARLRLGVARKNSGDYQQAAVELADAFFTARRCRADAVAVQSSQELSLTVGSHLARHDEGLMWARHAAAEADQGGAPADVAWALAAKGYLLGEAGDLDESRSTLDRSLAILETERGENDLDVGIVLGYLATTATRQGQHAEAVEFQLRGLEITEAVLGEHHPTVAHGLTDLGSMLFSIGKRGEARKALTRALGLREEILGPDHPHVATTLTNLGATLSQLGEQAEAVEQLERAMSIWERAFGTNHPSVAAALFNLALVVREQGDLDRSAEYMLRGQRIHERTLEPGDPRIAQGLLNLGGTRKMQSRHREARDHLERALAFQLEQLGPDHDALAPTHSNLGDVLRRLGEFDGARHHLERAKALWQSTASDHPDAAIASQALGHLFAAQRQHQQALVQYSEGLAVRLAALGPDHPLVAESLEAVARTELALGKRSEARDHAERAVAIFRAGESSPDKLASAKSLLAKIR